MAGLPPLEGITVMELTHGLAGRTAGALLADLGATVEQFPYDLTVPDAADPERVWSDRRKVIRGVGWSERQRLTEQRRQVDHVDVILSDLPPGALERVGLDAITTREQNPRLVHGWMPPFGTEGRWSHLYADPLLLAAVTGYADHFPASVDRPVAPAVPTFLYLQGAIGAAAVVSGLVGRETSGSGTAFRVSGPDAAGAALATLMMGKVEGEASPSMGRSLRGSPSFRLYQGSDGAWFFLAALTPGIFVRALEAIGRIDLFLREDVAGEFANMMVPAVRDEINAEMEQTFASAPTESWLRTFRLADVPAAPVWSRDTWLQKCIVPAARRHDFRHSVVGPMSVPDPPLTLPLTPLLTGGSSPTERPADPVPADGPVSVGELASGEEPASVEDPLTTEDGLGPPTQPGLPLAGLKVVDLCSFLAGPYASTLLADFGADVVKVEPTDGDPYAVFAVSYAVVNHAKNIAAIDLRDAGAKAAFLKVVAGSDVLVDNFTPESLDRLGLTAEVLAGANPHLIRCSISAFGADNDWSSTPGFDPVLQSMTGLAVAQGGAGSPVQSSAPVVDVTTGALGALGVVAALFVRSRSGVAQHVRTSLASGAVFVQSAEMTSYEGRPSIPTGALDYLGPSATRRVYEARDGWLAIATRTDGERLAVFEVVGRPELAALSDLEAAVEVAKEIRATSVRQWLDAFAVSAVPAASVVPRAHVIASPYLAANGLSHVIDVPGMGCYRVVSSQSQWNGRRQVPGSPPVRGRDSRGVLAAAGVSDAEIDDLTARKVVVAAPGRSEVEARLDQE